MHNAYYVQCIGAVWFLYTYVVQCSCVVSSVEYSSSRVMNYLVCSGQMMRITVAISAASKLYLIIVWCSIHMVQ